MDNILDDDFYGKGNNEPEQAGANQIWIARVVIVFILSFKIYFGDYRTFSLPMLKDKYFDIIQLLPIAFYIVFIGFNLIRLYQEYFSHVKISSKKHSGHFYAFLSFSLGVLFFNTIFQDLGTVALMLPALYFVARREVTYIKSM